MWSSTYTRTNIRGTSDSACSLFLPPQQLYETEEYPETGNQRVRSSSAEEVKFDLISRFCFPFEVEREEPGQSPYEPRNTHSVQNVSHFLGHKYGFKERLHSTSKLLLCLYYALRSEKRGIIKLCFLQDTLIRYFAVEWPIKGKINPTLGKYYNSLLIDW